MMIPIRLNPINPAHLLLIKQRKPFSTSRSDIKDDAVSLCDERLNARRAVLSDIRSDDRPEPREPCILEEGRREKGPELEGGE